MSSSLALSTAVTTSVGLDLTSTASAADARPRATRAAASRATSTARLSSASGSGDGDEEVTPPILPQVVRARRWNGHPSGPRGELARRGGKGGPYSVRVQGFGVDIGGSGIKGCLVDLEIGQLIGERVRIETPQPSLPDPVYGVVATIVDSFGWTGGVGGAVPRRVKHRGGPTPPERQEGRVGT